MKGGPFTKIWSYALKNLGLQEAIEAGTKETWSLNQLQQVFNNMKSKLADALIDKDMKEMDNVSLFSY